MAMTLSTSEIIPVAEGKLALGTWQSVLFFDLDGPRNRTVSIQIMGE
jgi:secondary thiamine-phosphate synthase enzyme